MTESQLFALALRFTPWAGFVIALVYIVVNKVGPVWLADWREARQQERQAKEAERKARDDEEREERRTTKTLYERVISQSTENIKFIASATEAIHGMTRSLDSNTQQMYHLTQSVERGPACPLPGCVYWDNLKEGREIDRRNPADSKT
jgi:hypothetical protein